MPESIRTRVKVKTAAMILNTTPLSIRVGMAQGVLPIGSCMQQGTRRMFLISAHLLSQYSGVPIDEIINQEKQ